MRPPGSTGISGQLHLAAEWCAGISGQIPGMSDGIRGQSLGISGQSLLGVCSRARFRARLGLRLMIGVPQVGTIRFHSDEDMARARVSTIPRKGNGAVLESGLLWLIRDSLLVPFTMLVRIT